MDCDTATVGFLEEQARKLTDYMLAHYSVKQVPCVLYWRQLVCDCFPHKSDEWRRDCNEVRVHLKRLFVHVREILEADGIQVLKVNACIKRFVNHGGMPERDENRNDSFYAECVPGPHQPAIGLVCFPRAASEDHPLVVATLSRRGSESANRFVNSVKTISQFEESGVISNDAAYSLGRKMVDKALPSITSLPETKLISHDDSDPT